MLPKVYRKHNSPLKQGPSSLCTLLKGQMHFSFFFSLSLFYFSFENWWYASLTAEGFIRPQTYWSWPRLFYLKNSQMITLEISSLSQVCLVQVYFQGKEAKEGRTEGLNVPISIQHPDSWLSRHHRSPGGAFSHYALCVYESQCSWARVCCVVVLAEVKSRTHSSKLLEINKPLLEFLIVLSHQDSPKTFLFALYCLQ